MIRFCFLISVFFGVLIFFTGTAMASPLVGGYPPDQALRLGERMYRLGLLPSGEPMEALVQGDIPVDGTMFSCESCHLSSGLGSFEGTIVTLPTNGGKLFKPLHRGAEIDVRPTRQQLPKVFQSQDIRPAYTDETLAEAIWNGQTPSGRQLLESMPRYLLESEDMDILIHYLKSLSDDISPGVNATTMSFATIITDEVKKADREAFLGVLQAYLKDHNSQNRHDLRRSRQGPFYHQDRFGAYRQFELQVWELSGPPSTWEKQLGDYYRDNPVFAVLSGLSYQPWAPIHDFCEKQQLPNILPLTMLPKITKDDWYTLYFSKGYYQEGEAAARYLRPRRGDQSPTIVQVVSERDQSLAASQGFTETWRSFGLPEPTILITDTTSSTTKGFWKKLAKDYPDSNLLIWLSDEKLRHVDELEYFNLTSDKLIFSSTLINENYQAIPEALRDNSLLTYPYRLPEDKDSRMSFVKRWLKVHNVPSNNLDLQARAYFLNWLMTGVLRMLGDDFYRDYFLDVADMMNDEVYASAHFPRLSFGPGQRFASKGCYLVRLSPGAEPKLSAESPWVIH